MLLFLISSLFVLSNGVPLQLQPLKNFNTTNLIAKLADMVSAKNLIAKLADGGSAKNLIAELADADPAKVQEVITLVEAMIGVAQNDLNALTVTSTDANSAYTAAVSTYDAALAAQTQGVTALQTAVTDALAAKNNAEGAKTGAQSSLDAEKNRIDAEVASLQQVVTILRGLSTSSVGAFVLNNQKPITYQNCFTACDGDVVVPQSEAETVAISELLPCQVDHFCDNRVWLGLKKNSNYVWERNGSPYVGWTNWGDAGGNNGSVRAAMLFISGRDDWSGHWSENIDDGRVYYCICQA